MPRVSEARCPECDRLFDFSNEEDTMEFFFGHDCEPSS